MSRMKLALIVVAALLLGFPAMAHSCDVEKWRGGGKKDDKRASSVFVTFNNKTANGIAAYVKGSDYADERVWVPEGKKRSRKISLKKKSDASQEIRLDYSRSASRTELLYFDVENGIWVDSGGRYPYTWYKPTGSNPKNVVCDRVWRKNKQRWDIDITFK